MNKHLIQTGRSYRQMLNAIELARKGVVVVYVEPTDNAAKYRRSAFERINGDLPLGLSVVSLSHIERASGGFNWDTMLPADHRDPRPGLVYIPDHHVAEMEYMRLAQSVMSIQVRMQQIYALTTGAKVHAVAEWEFQQEPRYVDKVE